MCISEEENIIQSTSAAEVHSLGLTHTPSSKLIKKQASNNIFNDEHTYSYCSNEKKQKIVKDANEVNDAVNDNNAYLTLRKNILKEIWKIMEPGWGLYCNEESNLVLFAVYDLLPESNQPQATKIVISFYDT